MKKTAALLAALALGVFAVHAGAESIDAKLGELSTGEVLSLSEDSTLSGTAEISGREVTLDLNGYTLEFKENAGIKLSGNASLTINDSKENGKIVLSAQPVLPNVMGMHCWISADNSSVTVNGGTIGRELTSRAWNGIAIDAENNSNVVINGGKIDLPDCDIGIFAMASKLEIAGGELIARESATQAIGAIFSYGSEINITGGKISGTYGIGHGKIDDVASGSITISGGTIDCTEQGIIVQDAGLEITGGVIKSENIAIFNTNSIVNVGADAVIDAKEAISLYGGTVNITGGTISGTVGAKPTDDVNISGGKFSAAPAEEYIADGYVLGADGTVTKKAAAAVKTELKAHETIGDTKATGFITTVTAAEELELTSISWDITSGTETGTTGEQKLGGVFTINGSATIGLVVDGIDDANASAKATVNNTIVEE